MKTRNQNSLPPPQIDKKSKILKDIYEDLNNSASFSSPYVLFKEAKKKIPRLKLKDVKIWLTKNRTYTMFRRVRLNFPRRKVLVRGPFHQYQADLMDFHVISRHNKGMNFLLNIIDCFSRFAVSIPIKNKRGITIKEALEKAFIFMKIPKKMQTDDGTEFYNSNVKNFFKEKKIIHFSTKQELKAQMVERFNRTVREKIFKKMSSENSLNFLQHLPSFLNGYNSRPRKILGFLSPKDVNLKNRDFVFEKLYGEYLKRKKKLFKFQLGQRVRIAAYRKTFRKTSDKSFTEEIFIIVDRLNTNPPTYKIQSEKDKEIIEGSFYESQLQEWNG